MDSLFKPLFENGVLAIVLGWFMLRNERQMNKLIQTLDEFQKTLYLQSKTLLNLARAIQEKNGEAVEKVERKITDELETQIDEGLIKLRSKKND